MAEENESKTVETTESGVTETEAVTNSTETKTKTVEELQAENERIAKALKDANREAASRRKRLEELEAQEHARMEAELTELEKAQNKLAELEARLAAEQHERMRTEVVMKTGLPQVFADRLKGETPEELEADAKAILEALPKQKTTSNMGATNPGANATISETVEQKKARLFGSGPVNPFDPEFVRAHGGGVTYVEKE